MAAAGVDDLTGALRDLVFGLPDQRLGRDSEPLVELHTQVPSA